MSRIILIAQGEGEQDFVVEIFKLPSAVHQLNFAQGRSIRLLNRVLNPSSGPFKARHVFLGE